MTTHSDPARLDTRLWRLLKRFPHADLDLLFILLSSKGGRQRILAKIEYLIEDGFYYPRGPNALRDRYTRRSREWLYVILADRKLFPDTKSVLRCANEIFDCDLTYPQFKWSGRTNLITRIWSRILRMPEDERKGRLREFFIAIQNEKEF